LPFMRDPYLPSLAFTNHFASLPDHFWSKVSVTPPAQPFLIHTNQKALSLLGLPEDVAEHPDFTAWFSGARPLPGAAEPLSTVYAGHQFGSFVPQLGDGRAHLLGQLRNAQGELWEIQLKGSGQTPYSRFGDGRAVLRSSLREYLCSEAMHALGIPTTRALCLIGSAEDVRRESIEKAAIVTRLSPSFIRFGHFEYFAFTEENPAAVKQLADFVITHHFPELQGRYTDWFAEIIRRTAHLMAKWQAVGFAHGVMNTDNFSILGLTIDYGPFGFLDGFDPGYICNHSDHTGRYAFDQQPSIGWWNLHVLAYALQSLLSPDQTKEALSTYWPEFIDHYQSLMRAKLGVTNHAVPIDRLVKDLLDMLAIPHSDYTRFFRALSTYTETEDASVLRDFLPRRTDRENWLAALKEAWQADSISADKRAIQMRQVNPKYILRNYLAEQAIRLATLAGDYREIDQLMHLLRHPFDEQPDMAHYASAPPDWAHAICISCSS